MEIAETREEALKHIMLLLEAVRGDIQELMELMDPMEQMWARSVQEQAERHLDEIMLNI